MAYRGTYRTKSGKNRFSFSFEKQSNGTVRAYVSRQPSYRGRPRDGHSTHRYGVNSRPYVCYEPQPRSLKSAINVAKKWSDKTERYIDRGGRF